MFLKKISRNQMFQNMLNLVVRKARNLGIIPHFPIVKDRAIEYGFITRELNLPIGGKILDVGFCESTLPFILAGLGYKMYGVDIRHLPIKYPGFKTYVGDIRNTKFPNKFFDRIIAASTIEHLGISTRYKSYDDINADRKAIIEMIRILKDDGKILMTVPFGKYSIDPVQRIYDHKNLKKILEGLKILKIEYAKEFEGYWAPASYEEVKDTRGYHAVALINICKQR